ncbi:Relaxase/mobilization nuclease family protein (plasmid) [Crinalium epipsammum PCC 9333]|uniref:Relaxase/mobilization nuclease family protein n=1 Tax=Crinalium epipsammum PCC 9333 TaxID=1173022 RepID=K9W890_9CYAN|nr:relaxase/mobilization nuclease domain-containing protein [Crinalium epipsammum]AFZ15690.1 Relaxase/mobilization nuclease family protein [Crinalium epipsammum PCC 9333]
MISNTIKGKSFSGCVKYVMNQSGAEMLDTNMSGRNALEMIAEFQIGRVINSNVKNIVFHASLSAAPGEELSNDTWRDLARDYLEGMGFDDNQYIVVRHHEPEDNGKHDHSHVHIVASRVKLTAECVSDSWDYLRSLNLMRELEQKYDLVPTPHHLSNQKEQHNPTKGEIRVLYQQQQEFEEGKRTEPPQPSARMKLQALIDELTQKPTTMTDLIDKLQSTGVEVRIKQTRNNIIQGISFAHPDWEHGFKGSDLGKHYSWAGLQTHKSVSFDPVRDAEAIANSATNSRASINKKIAAKHLQIEVADGIAGTVTAESQTASTRVSDTSATARSNRGVEICDRTIESADLQSDPGKQLVETAVSQLDRNTEQLTTAVSQLDRSTDDFSRRLERTNSNSRKRTEQSERELATAPIGARAENTAAREKPAKQFDLAKELNQLGSAVHEFNAELSLQIGRNRSAGSDSRTASSTARSSQPTASPTTGISAADISQQFEEINRIHDGIRRRRRTAAQEPVATTEFEQGANSLNATIDSLNQLNGYIAEGIKQLNAEGEGRTTQHREEIHFVRAEHDVSLASDRREDHQSGRVSGVLHGEGQNTSTPGLSGETNQGTRNSAKTNDDTSTTGADARTKSDEKAGSLWGIKGTKSQGQKPSNISLDAFLAILSIRQPQYHFYSSYAPSENTPEKKLEAYKITKSELVQAKKQWESSPVWEQRQNWERNLITKAFESFISSEQKNSSFVRASFSYPPYEATLSNGKTLEIHSQYSRSISYKTHRDHQANECTIEPKYQQDFLLPGQQLEINHEAEQQLENNIQENQQLVEQKPKELDTTRNQESNSLNPEPATPVLPTKRLELPKDTLAAIDYLDKIYHELVTEVKQDNNFTLRDDLDVGVALFALNEGYSNKDVKHILLRSPKSQDFQHDPKAFEKFYAYREERLAIALTLKQLEDDPKQNKRVTIVDSIVEELFKTIKYGQSQVEDNYTFKRVGNTCTVIAHDERGEVFKLNGKWIEKCNLTDEDVRQWQQISEKLKEKEQERQNSLPRYIPSPSNEQKQLEL